MRYKEFNKEQRNKDLLAYQKKHPDLSLEEIGQHFSISKQRVSQILQKHKNGKGKRR